MIITTVKNSFVAKCAPLQLPKDRMDEYFNAYLGVLFQMISIEIIQHANETEQASFANLIKSGDAVSAFRVLQDITQRASIDLSAVVMNVHTPLLEKYIHELSTAMS